MARARNKKPRFIALTPPWSVYTLEKTRRVSRTHQRQKRNFFSLAPRKPHAPFSLSHHLENTRVQYKIIPHNCARSPLGSSCAHKRAGAKGTNLSSPRRQPLSLSHTHARKEPSIYSIMRGFIISLWQGGRKKTTTGRAPLCFSPPHAYPRGITRTKPTQIRICQRARAHYRPH